MESIRKLSQSLDVLKSYVSGFPIGAVTPDDFKPTEEKIQDLKVSLRCLSSRLQMLQIKMQSTDEAQHTSEYNAEDVDQLSLKLSTSLINDNASQFCIHSATSGILFFSGNADAENRKQLKVIMKKLFMLNDEILNWQNTIVELSNREIDLKHECSQSINAWHYFLEEQESIRNKKLEESNPEVARYKERVKRLVFKINLMKRLITNFVSAASKNVEATPILAAMLKKHRDLISIDTVVNMIENRENDHED